MSGRLIMDSKVEQARAELQRRAANADADARDATRPQSQRSRSRQRADCYAEAIALISQVLA